MSKVEIICLANSRKLNGRCIAGIRTDWKGWIRPVGKKHDKGALLLNEYTLENGNEPKKLSVIEISVSEAKPKAYQPENVLIISKPWRLITENLTNSHLLLIKSAFFQGNNLFGTTSDRILESEFQQTPAKTSLELIQPENIQWVITYSYTGKRQIRVIFYLQSIKYNLVVTDPDWVEKLKELTIGHYSSKEIGIPQVVKFLFTISLGEPYNGYCYKLVAAVIPYLPHPI